MKTNKKEVKSFGELTDFLSEKFDKIDEKFDKIDEKFDKIDEKFGEVNKKLDTLDEKVDTLDKKTDRIDENLDSLAIITNHGFIEAQKDREAIKEKLSRTEEKIISVIRMDKERNSEFHIKIVEILEKNKLVNKKDLDYLMILAK